MLSRPESLPCLFRFRRLASAAGLLFCGSTAALAAPDFAREVKPIFTTHCTACHGGVKKAGGVSFIMRDHLFAKTKSGATPAVPGNPDASEIIRRITTADEDDRMPPAEHGSRLKESEITILREWIKSGAEWTEHWAFRRPEKAPLPPHSPKPVDAFILARLEADGLRANPEGDRPAWLRRVSFDLTGLPPSPEELNNFAADGSPEAYEKVVDRLLASPRYGERWASLWLDLSRYADTQGFEKDAGRTVWPYRDWLIRAFNDDLPYDQFVLKQLAGDLLPNAGIDDRLATTFHRNTQTNSEGGTDDEEFRIAAVTDRVSTTWEVFQGVTFRCTQCHAHPYDPIPHQDYYRFMAFFNTSRDCDLNEELPLLSVPNNPADAPKAADLDRRISALREQIGTAVWQLAAEPKSAWRWLRPHQAASTGSTELAIAEHEGVPEIRAGGTITLNSRYTLEIPVPQELTALGALRLDALPENPDAAAAASEFGFVVSRLKAWILTQGAPPLEIAFKTAFDDDPQSFFEADQSLRDDSPGWGAYPRMNRPHSAVFVPEKPVPLPAGASLKLEIHQNMSASSGTTALVIRRGRIAISPADIWPALLEEAAFSRSRGELAAVRQQRQAIPSTDVPTMAEQAAAKQRETKVFQRGNWMDLTEKVAPGVPAVFGGLPPGAPPNRLGLAKWMGSKHNPLTARVAVNRVWEQLFGAGLVDTLEDFGTSGQPPSHPQLLDWLAAHFQDDLGWSQKRLLKELVLSGTYRQSRQVTPEKMERDPRNRLLSRGPRTRLTAEMMRDQALAAAGLLSGKMHGPPVMPRQPEGIWRSLYNSGKWETSKGEDQYRRAIYTYWKRTSGYPGFITFDAPSREVCASRRVATNTPLQALAALNDPVFMEAAQALARRMMAEGGPEVAAQIHRGFTLAANRPPTGEEAATLAALHARALAKYQADPNLAKSAGDPASAALALTANAILNLDCVLTK